mgnify:CR=1 FL=1
MTTSITNKNSRGAVLIENALFYKLYHNLVAIGPSSYSFLIATASAHSFQYSFNIDPMETKCNLSSVNLL